MIAFIITTSKERAEKIMECDFCEMAVCREILGCYFIMVF